MKIFVTKKIYSPIILCMRVWNYLNNLYGKKKNRTQKNTLKKVLQNIWLIYRQIIHAEKWISYLHKIRASFQTTSWYCWQDFIFCHSDFRPSFVYLLHTCSEYWIKVTYIFMVWNCTQILNVHFEQLRWKYLLLYELLLFHFLYLKYPILKRQTINKNLFAIFHLN